MSNDSWPLARTRCSRPNVREHLNQALVEAEEIADSVLDLSVLHVEGAVAGHAAEIFS